MFANFSLRLVRAIAGKVRSAEYRPRADGGLAKVVKALSAQVPALRLQNFHEPFAGRTQVKHDQQIGVGPWG